MKNNGKVCDVRSLTIHWNISEIDYWVWLLHYGTVDFIVWIALRKRRGPSFSE